MSAASLGDSGAKARPSLGEVGARPLGLHNQAMRPAGPAIALLALMAGCAEPYLLTDGTSVSLGRDNGGVLRCGCALPVQGDGWVFGRVWAARRSFYGTDELVDAIERNAHLIESEFPGTITGVADMSHRGGGATTEHHSHQSGRDVDILYFGDDRDGNVLPPPEAMIPYRNVEGWSEPTPGPDGIIPPRRFDTARNWAMVRAWLTDPDVQVQWIFVYSPIRQRLLYYAESIGEPDDILERAEAVLHQPSDSMPHDDHMHIRIYCSPSDVALGCVDIGPYRWLKKYEKYPGRYPNPPKTTPSVNVASAAPID